MNREEARKKAIELVSQMTVEEAAGQLRYDAPAIERLGIPAYNWWNEALHGTARAGMATMFPQAIGIAAMFDPELTEKLGKVAGTEGRAKYNAASAHGDRGLYKGLTFWSPNVNIFRDPRWGRGHETYGEDPYLTGETGAAYVRGLQGKGDTMLAAACAKHFAVHSGPESKRHGFDARASEKDLSETYLPAFRRLVEEGVEAIMGAYNRTNGEPSCASPRLMKILREDWGFEGHFLSDCGAIRDFHAGHKVTSGPVESVTKALSAGCDLNCGCTYEFVMEAYQQGKITEEMIRRSAVRLFTTRYLLGIVEGSEYDKIPFDVVECPKHLAAARRAAEESCVLLKNNGILPLKKENLKTLGVIGPNANSRSSLIGNYHGTSSRYITVLEGLQDALGDDVRIYASEGCHLFKDRLEGCSLEPDDRISEAITVAERSDVVILVLGLDETLEGEEGDASNADASGDKKDLRLPQSQRNLAKAVLAVGKPTILCLMAGSAVDPEEAAEKSDAVLMTWYPGARGGRTVADILLGMVSPSGKLPVTFYRNEQLEELPDFENYSMTNRTYRYFTGKPLYPFGYGLTYGKCRVTAVEKTEQGVRVTARNEGSADTEEVLQIYCKNEGTEHGPVNPRLVAYRRVFCPAGQEITCEIAIDERELTVCDEQGRFREEGTPVFYVGFGQPDARTEELTGTASVELRL